MKKMKKTVPFFLLACVTAGCQQQCEEDVVCQSYVHRYGVEVTEDAWHDEGQEGKIVTILATGVVRTETYKNGVLEGETTFSLPHSDVIEKTVIYSQGVELAEILHYQSGVPFRRTDFVDVNKNEVTVWYENGIPQAKETYIQGKLVEGEYHTPKQQVEAKVENSEGTRIVRDGYGQLISQDTIKNGVCTTCTTFHPNGTPKEVVPLADTAIHGEKKTYSPTGEPLANEQWMGGVQNGISVIYRNGVKWAEVPYVNGVKQGIEIRYKEDGQKSEEISWINDEMTGPYYSYLGGNVQVAWYYKGKAVQKAMYDRMTNN